MAENAEQFPLFGTLKDTGGEEGGELVFFLKQYSSDVAQDGSIRVESEPEGAKIYLDDDYIGTTPDSIRRIVPGMHSVVVKMDGYKVWSQKVVVEAGDEATILASLGAYTDPKLDVPVINLTESLRANLGLKGESGILISTIERGSPAAPAYGIPVPVSVKEGDLLKKLIA